jgi:SOS response regulatory protein OraA/RecX
VDLLRRRELSEAQVRERLAEAGHKPKAIETAVAKLKQAGAIDDLRAAEAIVRTETAAKKRSKLRVRLQVERAGIAAAIARRVVDDHFATMDDDVIMEAILEKRLRGRDTISSESELQRLQRYLVGQGFEPDRVARALAARQRTRPSR